jgi:hypothetical protein
MHIQKSIILGVLSIAALGGTSLNAASWDMGGQIGASTLFSKWNPNINQDHKLLIDNRLGGLFGFQVQGDLGDGHGVRFRLEGVSFQGKKGVVVSENYRFATGRNRMSTSFLGADYLYSLTGDLSRGPYLLAGLGVSSNAGYVSGESGDLSYAVGREVSRLGYAVGGGYQVNRHFSLEARLGGTTWVQSEKLNTFNLVANYRF